MLEEAIFEKSIFKGIGSLIDFGFNKINNKYIKEYILPSYPSFKAIIQINEEGKVRGSIVDLEFGDNLLNWRVGSQFIGIRDEYIEILIEIKNKCFIINHYICATSNKINDYIYEKYNVEPEFLWERYPGYGVYRAFNSKWFGIIMNVNDTELMNLKVNPKKIEELMSINGIHKAYHMNKDNWISVDMKVIEYHLVKTLVDESYNEITKPSVWIIPTNPLYYDVTHLFSNSEIECWKQYNNINVGDILYIYVTKPIGEVYFKCEVLKVNIPFEFDNEHVNMSHVIEVKCLKKFLNHEITFEKLKSLGIKTIRGPRTIKINIED